MGTVTTTTAPSTKALDDDRMLAMAMAPDWYVTGCLQAMGSLVAQGLQGSDLLRAWHAYGAGAPEPVNS